MIPVRESYPLSRHNYRHRSIASSIQIGLHSHLQPRILPKLPAIRELLQKKNIILRIFKLEAVYAYHLYSNKSPNISQPHDVQHIGHWMLRLHFYLGCFLLLLDWASNLTQMVVSPALLIDRIHSVPKMSISLHKQNCAACQGLSS